MTQLAIFVILTAKAGQRDSLLALWRQQVQNHAEENPLEVSYVYGFELHNPAVVTIVEVFDSMDAFHATAHTQWFKDYMKDVALLLERPPEYQMGIPQWTKMPRPPGERSAQHNISEVSGGAALPHHPPSLVATVINMLPPTGPIRKVQEFLNSRLAISVTFKTKPGQRDAVRQIWQDVVRHRAAENPAESNYVYAFDSRDDTIIRLAETFASMDAFHQIARARWFKNYLKAITPMLEGKPQYHMSIPQWVK